MLTNTKRGFTLVELSIVLVIIGLLIGGILVAQSMISTSKVLRFASDLGRYEVAINNFKQAYKNILAIRRNSHHPEMAMIS